MEITVEPNKTYAVTTSGSCTVVDADGLELCTANAGQQSFFVATTPVVIVSDNKAKVSRANFNGALARSSAGGGASADGLPAGYTAIEYLESTGTQYIQTNWLPPQSSKLGIKTDVEVSSGAHEQSIYINVILAANSKPYGLGLNKTGCVSVSEKGKKTMVESKTVVGYNNRKVLELVDNTLYIDGVQEEKLSPYGGWGDARVWDSANAAMIFKMPTPSSGSVNKMIIKAKLYSLRFSENDEVVCELVPAINPNGEPCLYDKLGGRAFTNVGTGRFIAGLSGLTALSNLLLKLPHHETAGSILDIRLPDNVNQEEVTRLCDLAGTYKNWQIDSI